MKLECLREDVFRPAAPQPHISRPGSSWTIETRHRLQLYNPQTKPPSVGIAVHRPASKFGGMTVTQRTC